VGVKRLSWRQNGDYPESMYSIEFRERYLEIAKLLSDQNGFYVAGKEAIVDGYNYKVKLWFIVESWNLNLQ